MIYGVIDLGSNTIRLSVYKCEENDVKILFHRKTVAGIAGYVKNNILSQNGIRKACSVLNAYKQFIENFEINQVFIFATASLRNIKNTKEAVDMIRKETGFSVEVLSGEEEAFLGFIGASHSLEIKDGVLIDIGGGSTEIVVCENGQILKAVSIPFGSLSTYSLFVSKLLPKKSERHCIRDAIIYELDKIEGLAQVESKIICGLGGSVRSAAKLNNNIFDLNETNKEVFVENIKKMIHLLDGTSKECLLTILRVVPERIHTIIPGLIILNTIAQYFKSEVLMVSSFGVREGFLYSKVLKEDFSHDSI